ncbi:hypothetical protein IM793_19340 [Pedobacter sp. MR2016-19]|uniref:hypothetical protein n=1 Tax=Pedobacter sp. MR2016-19 TaxID=2780089 RepID=UPI001875677D|nr:hypothetical protein [Pedobacter sp. MR2016-19]MBE5321325.1 hypothetical protein [Pedobacter sp. MR2016-19]
MKLFFISVLFITVVCSCKFAEDEKNSGNKSVKPALKIRYLHEKDPDFNLLNNSIVNIGKGKTKLLIDVRTKSLEHYIFAFKENIIKISNYGGDSVDVYGLDNKPVRKDYVEPVSDTTKMLSAFIIKEQNNKYIKKCTFQDSGSELYYPTFEYKYCLADDIDNDGQPEFYLTYFGESDGLDAKPLKVITYYHFKKVKATAYYPAGNEEDEYYIDYDKNWKTLPKIIQKKVNHILESRKSETKL